MKTTNWKFLTMSMLAGMTAFTSCDNEDGNDPTPDPEPNPVEYKLEGEITSDMTLEAGQTYTLSGGVHVKKGATLSIPEGVKIVAQYDDVADYILIEQGAKINAIGTAEKPIVMTSSKEEVGSWGGLHICGYAHTNVSGGTGVSEIGGATYGGDDDADNSGTLKYIRLEYTGFALDEEHESNGISFYGVGNGTVVENIQAYKGADDGLEFFGGSVNVKNIVVTSCSDDSFDWTEGWNGKGQFLVAYQEGESSLGYDCDCLMECDNNSKDLAATPTSHPVLANVTLVGNGGEKQGVRLRAGTQVELYNAIIANKGKALTVETLETENSLADGTSVLENVAISTELDSENSIYTNDMFVKAGNLTNQKFELSDLFVGTIEGGSKVEDSFFVDAPYKGAVSADNNWTAGWTL